MDLRADDPPTLLWRIVRFLCNEHRILQDQNREFSAKLELRLWG
jgi:hypothetical protein